MIDYKLVKKAYSINFNKIDEEWCYDKSQYISYAETKSKAKYELLNKIKYECLKLTHTNDDITFTNIPIIRNEDFDLYLFENQELTLNQINKIIDNRKRISKLEEILNDSNITHCYIYKNGYYYAPGSCGYVSKKSDAGIYKKDDAIESAKSCQELYIEPIDNELHNKMILEKIEDLKTRMI